MRDTVERSLGALLVARRVRSSPENCPELAAILDGWDGDFTVLMRKRVARHIESCPMCDDERSRMLTPAALLGGAPLFIPAPAWLREHTLTAAHSVLPGPASNVPPSARASEGKGEASRRRTRAMAGAALVGLIVGAAVTIATLQRNDETAIIPVVVTTTDVPTSTVTQPVSIIPAPLPPPPETSAPDVARTVETTSALPTAAAPVTTTTERAERPPVSTTVTEDPTQSFTPTVRSTPTATPEETTTEEPTSSPSPESTTRTSRRLPTVVGTVGPATIVETTTIPPIN
jgi:hypothetical protein